MFTVDNKFEIGEEVYTAYRKPTHHKCPVCEGNGKFLHNGYEVWCRNCNGTGKLYNPKQYVLDVCKVRVRRIKVSRYEEVNSIKYCVTPIEPALINVKNRSDNNLFKTIEEAEQYCVDVNTDKIKGEF